MAVLRDKLFYGLKTNQDCPVIAAIKSDACLIGSETNNSGDCGLFFLSLQIFVQLNISGKGEALQRFILTLYFEITLL